MYQKIKIAVVLAISVIMTAVVFSGSSVHAAPHAGSDTCPPGQPTVGLRFVCDGFFSGDDAYDAGLPGIDVSDVIQNGVGSISLQNVHNVNDFVTLVSNSLNGTGDDVTGAAYLIATMLDHSGTEFSSITDGVTQMKAAFPQWENLIRYYDFRGWVNWNPTNTNTTMAAPFLDTAMSIRGTHDVILYVKQANESAPLITFSNPDGSAFTINKNCGNPTGTGETGFRSLAEVPDFTLVPGITTEVTHEGVTTAVDTAVLGDEITVTHTIKNDGPDDGDGTTTCTIYGQIHNGTSYAPGATASQISDPGYTPPATNCSTVIFNGGTYTVVTETIPVTTPNQTICRSLYISAAVPLGSPVGAEACVYVSALASSEGPTTPVPTADDGSTLPATGESTPLVIAIGLIVSSLGVAILGRDKLKTLFQHL